MAFSPSSDVILLGTQLYPYTQTPLSASGFGSKYSDPSTALNSQGNDCDHLMEMR